MFTLTPRDRNARQTAGRDFTSLLKAKGDALRSVIDEVDQFGQSKAGGEIMQKIAAMTPEEKAKADFMSLGAGRTQSQQTMDMLEQLAGQQEKQKGRDFSAEESQKSRDFTSAESAKSRSFTASENAKSREASRTLATLKDSLNKGTPLAPDQVPAVIEGLKTVNRDIMLKRSQMEASNNPKEKADLYASIMDLSRQVETMEGLLNPDGARGISTQRFETNVPSQYAVQNLVKPKYKK